MLTSNELMYKLPKTQKRGLNKRLDSCVLVRGCWAANQRPANQRPAYLSVSMADALFSFLSQGLLKLFLKLVLKLNIEMVHSVALKTKHKKKTKS